MRYRAPLTAPLLDHRSQRRHASSPVTRTARAPSVARMVARAPQGVPARTAFRA
jgi:hypothetical protein